MFSLLTLISGTSWYQGPVDATVSVPPAVPSDSPHAQILSLLRVLHKMNAESLESLSLRDRTSALPETAFINNKLTAKLTRQLEEPMIVARYAPLVMF